MTSLLVLALPVAAQNEARYKVRLAPVPMDIAMRSTVAGRGSAPATIARLYQGPAMGIRGAAFGDLTVSKAANGMISGSITLTPEQARALERGRVYLQISSERAPDGNLWGWFVR